MSNAQPKTFWDIEKEKTWRIYVLFCILILFYFFPVFIIWSLFKVFLELKHTLNQTATSFHIFGLDTLLIFAAAGLAAGIHWYYSNKMVVSKALHLLGARTPDKRDRYHCTFQNIVDEIETAAGGIKVERFILPTGAMNAFALADLNGRRVIGITEGLLSRLTRSELQAVVALEMSHIVSNDCLQTTITCSLFDIYSEAIVRFNRAVSRHEPQSPSMSAKAVQQDTIMIGALSLPAFLLLFITTFLGRLLNMLISREREYRADASAIRLTRDPGSLASGLYKIATHWRGAGCAGEYMAAIFILNPRSSKLDEKDDFFAALFSTHPPLLKRLSIILRLAHIDIAEITRHVADHVAIKTEGEVVKPDISFRVRHTDSWQGPFTILQLQTLDWLEPDTELKMSGHDDILRAEEVPALSYFFQIRNEPIWKMRRLCPDCRKWLIVQGYEGLFLWRCAFCNGLLVEEEKLPRIFARREKGFPERVQRIAALMDAEAKKTHPHFNVIVDIPRLRPCPKCGRDMVHKFYSYAYHIEIDECQACKLIWFDPDELEILQCMIEMEDKA
jgi:heat shock protein HtpX